MVDIEKVSNCWSLNARNAPSMDGTPVKWYQQGDEVRVYATSGNWYNTSENGNWWVYNKYVTKIGSDPVVEPAPAPPTNTVTETEDITEISKENTDIAVDDTVYGTSNSSYNKLLKRYLVAFGSPPRYTERVDPYYNSENLKVGRAMMQTWFSEPAIFSICPGTVDYLPGFSSSDKETFWNSVEGLMTGDLKSRASRDRDIDLNGKLYAFKSAYKDYMNVVNLLARISANYLGIGDVTNMMSGSNVPLKKFDYGYFTDPSKSKKAKSIFQETKNALNTAVSDGAYIHFFVNSSGTSVTEAIRTESGRSILEETINGSELSNMQRNIQFLFGGALNDEAKKDLSEIIADANRSNTFMGSFATMASNYLKGGRLVFPQMITNVDYSKSFNVQMTFTSVYGDRRSIFKYTILPALHLLALAMPKQLSDSMYTYPFLCRIYQKGSANCDLAFISNLDLKRGGSDDIRWTVDSLPTEINASFTVTPLYTNMMVTSSTNPFLAMNNTALMEYLGTMCGLDLKANNFNVKVNIAKQLIGNKVSDIPTNLARGIVDSKLLNEIRKWTQIIN